MVACIVCQYWSERLRESRTHFCNKRPSDEESRLIAALRAHQVGACACRFPTLLENLVRQEPPVQSKASGICDPVRIRILLETAPNVRLNSSRTDSSPAPKSRICLSLSEPEQSITMTFSSNIFFENSGKIPPLPEAKRVRDE